MRIFLIAAFSFTLSLFSTAQQLSSTSKKALKLYEQAQGAIKNRDFDLGIELYKRSIQRDPDFLEAYLRLGNAYSVLRLTDSSFVYYSSYWDRADYEHVHPRTAAMLAQLNFDRGEYGTARKCLDLAIEKTNNDPKVVKDLLDKSIDFALNQERSEPQIVLEMLPPEVNRFYTQYFPAVTIDNQTLFFTKRDGGSVIYDEDLVVSYNRNGSWSAAESVSAVINSDFNEGACSISADGRTLVFTACEDEMTFGSCDIFISIKEGDTWSKPQNMGSSINSKYWDSQPSLSADGHSIYFSSNRPGGKGNRDIWVSRLSETLWSVPQNLGDGVNSPGDETTPFIHVNGETLFFASNGRVGMGGYDLYSSESLNEKWNEARNLGSSINDHHDQLSLIIVADGQSGYFAHESRSESGDIRSQLMRIVFDSDTLVSHSASYVTGHVKNKLTGKPIPAQIDLYDLETSIRKYSTQTDPVSGIYFFALNSGNEYGAYVTSEGYLFEDFRFEVSQNTALAPDTLDIYLTPIEEGVAMVLENIYFELDSYEINNRSQSELEVIAQFIAENGVKVEISGHTDESGTQSYNQRLSSLRAEAVYYYLIKLGVNPELLSFQGYGATRLRYKEKDDIHLNRRIEFEIIRTR